MYCKLGYSIFIGVRHYSYNMETPVETLFQTYDSIIP